MGLSIDKMDLCVHSVFLIDRSDRWARCRFSFHCKNECNMSGNFHRTIEHFKTTVHSGSNLATDSLWLLHWDSLQWSRVHSLVLHLTVLSSDGVVRQKSSYNPNTRYLVAHGSVWSSCRFYCLSSSSEFQLSIKNLKSACLWGQNSGRRYNTGLLTTNWGSSARTDVQTRAWHRLESRSGSLNFPRNHYTWHSQWPSILYLWSLFPSLDYHANAHQLPFLSKTFYCLSI